MTKTKEIIEPNQKSKGKKNKNKDNKIKEIQGKLDSFNEKQIAIELEDNQMLNIERNNISLIKTVFDWESV